MSKQPQPAPTARVVGPCPTVIQIVGRPGTGSLPRAITPPDHPQNGYNNNVMWQSACLATINNFASLFNGTPVEHGSGSMMDPI